MRRSLLLAVGLGVGIGAVVSAQAPPAASPSDPVAPWANKFFLPDIATNREQTAPPAIVHNFGDVPHGTLCVHKFTVTNVYDVPMQVTEVRKSCQCLDYVPLTRVLQPNETAELVVTMDAGKFSGSNTQTLYVTFGPKFISTAIIKLQANSRNDVTLNPGAVAFGTVAQGGKAGQSVMIRYGGRSRDWKLTEVVPPQGPFDVQLAEVSRGGPLRGGAEYRLDVALKPTAPAGVISEQVTLKTNDPKNPLLQVSVTGTVVAPLEVTPDKVRIDAIPVGQQASQRVLVRAAKAFRVLGVDGADKDGVTVELPPSPPGVPFQAITIKFEPKQPGPVALQLRIRTDLDGGASVLLPVEAEGVK
jgi:hypothetical protein